MEEFELITLSAIVAALYLGFLFQLFKPAEKQDRNSELNER
jgi:hypothetical protein